MTLIFNSIVATAPWAIAFTAIFTLLTWRLTRNSRSNVEMSRQEWEAYQERCNVHGAAIVQEQKGATDLATSALRSAIIINGTSAAATLAFIGRLWAIDGSTDVIHGLVAVFAILVTGTFSASLATVFGYLRMYFGTVNWNHFLHHNKNSFGTLIVGDITQAIAFLLVIESYALFGYAMADAIDILRM